MTTTATTASLQPLPPFLRARLNQSDTVTAPGVVADPGDYAAIAVSADAAEGVPVRRSRAAA